MKTLKKIKLNQLSKVELENREMNALKGGDDCGNCVCVCVIHRILPTDIFVVKTLP